VDAVLLGRSSERRRHVVAVSQRCVRGREVLRPIDVRVSHEARHQ
jgi:hypothetical protein